MPTTFDATMLMMIDDPSAKYAPVRYHQ